MDAKQSGPSPNGSDKAYPSGSGPFPNGAGKTPPLDPSLKGMGKVYPLGLKVWRVYPYG